MIKRFADPKVKNLGKLTAVQKYSGLPAQYYVSPNGDDSNDGSRDFPFATVSRASTAVKKDIVDGKINSGTAIIALLEGTYNFGGIEFDSDLSGNDKLRIVYRGEGQVTNIDGGLTLSASDFSIVESEEERNRLSDDAKENVLCVDLKKLGLSIADVGNLCGIGADNTTCMYDDDSDGVNCELFIDGKRMRIARYPDTGYLAIDNVCDIGEVAEFPDQNYITDFFSLRNPRGGTIIIDKKTNDRTSLWKEPEKAWIHGYFYHDWSDSSSRVEYIKNDVRTMKLCHASKFGYRAGAPYYFYNVFEELDAPGEWYLDRDNLSLYIYPPVGFNKDSLISLSILTRPLVILNGCRNITFENINFRFARDNGTVMNNCDGVEISACSISCVYTEGISAKNCTNCRITGTEISHTGSSGMSLGGGDRVNLISSGNIIENCLVHDFSEVTLSCLQGIKLDGCGGRITHCEIHSSPTVGIGYTGNNHIIEYNVLHDLVLHADDAAAFYTGSSWTSRGTVLR